MATKTITIDFWRVQMPKKAGTFEDALKAAASLPDDDSRALEINGALLRLQKFSTSPARREGDLIRIRMDEVPVVASLDGDVQVVDLEDDEGFGEEASFLYIPSVRTLVVQRNWFAVSASRLVGYFQEAAQLNGNIVLEPVVEPATMANFKKLHEIRKFDVKVAGVQNAQTIKGANPGASVKTMADLIDELDGVNAHIEVTMGHDQGSLSVQAVKTAARNLVKIAKGTNVQVRKIEITGRSVADEKLVVDLLRDRMIEKAQVTLDADRRIPYSERKRALRDAQSTRMPQLQSLFGQPGN